MSIYFDMETTGLNPTVDSVVCAVTRKDGEVIQWVEPDRPAKTCGPELLARLAAYLTEDDCPVVTFNGLGFDFWFLCEKIADAALSKKLAVTAIYHHTDIYYCFFTVHGYRTSLASLLTDSTIEKPMTGKEASERWEHEIDEVVDYCAIDTAALEYIHTTILKQKFISRTSKAGKQSRWVPFLRDNCMRTVKQCIEDVMAQPPDTSWMSDPPNLHEPYEWAIKTLSA